MPSARLLFTDDANVTTDRTARVPEMFRKIQDVGGGSYLHPQSMLEGYARMANDQLEREGLDEGGYYWVDEGEAPICPDCGRYNERRGHQDCMYPHDA